MVLLYLSVLLRAAADVLLFAFLPLYLHQGLGDGHVGLISLFIAVPAGVRFVTAPKWGRKASETGRFKPLIIAGLGAYAAVLIVLPRVAQPLVGLALLTAASLMTSAFGPVCKTWITLNDDQSGLLRLATWYQWESAGYFISGTVFGLLVSDASVLVDAATMLAIVIGADLVLLSFRLPSRPSPEKPPPRMQHSTSTPRVRPATLKLAIPVSLLAFILWSSLTWEAVATTFGMYYVNTLGATTATYGMVLSAATFVGLVCYRPFARLAKVYAKVHGFNRVLWIAALGYSLMYLLMASRSTALVGIAYLLPLSGVVRTGVNLWLTDHVRATERGAAFGILESTEAAAAVLGTVLGGLCADRYGLASVPTVALASTVVLYFLVLNHPPPKHA